MIPQIEGQAAADDAFLRANARSRYLGLEPTDVGTWFANVHKRSPEDGRLLLVSFPGATPAESLSRARTWVEQQLTAADRRAA